MPQLIKCGYCGRALKTGRGLVRHITRQHSEVDTSQEDRDVETSQDRFSGLNQEISKIKKSISKIEHEISVLRKNAD